MLLLRVFMSVVALLLAIGVARAGEAAPGGLEATWLVEDGSTRIRFEPCGTSICGRIVWLREPNDPETGGPVLDKQNPNPALRARRLHGLIIFTGITAKRPGEWQGTVYNAEDGASYQVGLRLTDAGHVEITGCGLGGLICQSERWARVD